MGALTIFGHVEGEVRASSLVGSLAAACSDPPQTVHVAFMSLKPLFSYGKGQTWSRVMAKKKNKKSKSKT